MNGPALSKSLLVLPLLSLFVVVGPACSQAPEESVQQSTDDLSANERIPRYAKIKDAAAARGISNAFLLAGIAFSETGVAMCHSEASYHCPGPGSPDCGGGPILAGSADGPCGAQQGGLGMFQFDAGTYSQTINTYGGDVLTIDGQVSHAIDFVVAMVRDSAYTTEAETTEKARGWLNRFDINNGTLRDQWIRTVVRGYNGCQEGWSCWSARYGTYNDGLSQVLADTGGTGFWASGTRCAGGSGMVVGMIDAKYRALGGCGSILGVPISDEYTAPDRRGRFSVFERGSIYWTEATGANEVHGIIRDHWKTLDWETGPIGYPISDEMKTPDGAGRFNVFERGSIYWTEATGAHDVRGRIRDKWKELGWEAGALGYPVSTEYDVPGGRKSDFQHGSITWMSATDELIVEMAGAGDADAGAPDSRPDAGP